MPDDEQDKAGVVAPPPLIYLTILLFGLLLGRRFPIRCLPRKMARGLGMPLLGGGVLLLGWFEMAMRQADTPSNPYKPVERIATEGPFRYSRNHGYLAMTMNRARGALPGGEVRRRVPELQSTSEALDLRNGRLYSAECVEGVFCDLLRASKGLLLWAGQ